MKNSRSISNSPSSRETLAGVVYVVLQLFVLPNLLYWVNDRLANPLSEAEVNFSFYLINFMMMLLIFHDFLGRSARHVVQHPADFCQAVILGFVAYYACSYAANQIIRLLLPAFTNYNDEAIAAMDAGNSFLVFIGTVILVPPFEECIYRGMIFRNLYKKSPWAAYLISMVLFAAIHILGYIRVYTPLELTLAVLQYLPAGLCLAWCYIKGGSVFAPIAVHAAINYISIQALR